MIFGIPIDLLIKDNFTSVIDKKDNIIKYYPSGYSTKDDINMISQI